MFWWEKPFVRIFFFYTAGILLVSRMPSLQAVPVMVFLFITVVFILFAILLYYRNRTWSLSWVNGLVSGLIIFFLGIFFTAFHYSETARGEIKNREAFYFASVIREPVIREKTVKVLLRLTEKLNAGDTLFSPVRVLAFVAKDSLAETLKYGDQLILNGRPVKPGGPKNPGEFDYAGFLKMNGINYTIYLKPAQWKYLGYAPSNPFISLSGKARKYLLHALEINGLDDQRLAVVAAMLLGYDDLMNPEIEQQYVTAGAMHILCVSGLHVGIVYLVMNFLLSFIGKKKAGRIIKPAVMLVVIWAYALLTGLSPSVSRAAIMISLFILAGALNRMNDPYNTLAASAVLLLFYNPLLLYNVGFQLSYSAVLGILIFYRPIYNLLYIRYHIPDKLWAIVAVSFAAQLGTFPLAAHYFHYFPVYFWITNIFIIPLSFVIIAGGFAFIVFSWVPYISHLLGMALSAAVYLLNKLVSLAGILPYHGFYDLYFPWEKVAMVYALILLMFMVFLKKKIKYLLPAMVVLLLLIGYQTLDKMRLLRQEKVILYSLNKHTAFDFIDGQNHVCLVDSALFSNPQQADYQMENSRISLGLRENYALIDTVFIQKESGFYYNGEFGFFDALRFMVINGKFPYHSMKGKKQKLDVIISRGKAYLDPEAVRKVFDFDLLITDASVPAWKSRKLEAWANEHGVLYYDVKKNGAWVFDMNKSTFRP